MRQTPSGGKPKDMRILAVRFSALGDVAMTLPAIYSVARGWPNVRIDVLTRPFFARIFMNPPANIRVLTADFKTQYKGLAGMLRLFFALRGNHYLCVADLHNVSRSWFLDALFRLCGTRVAMVDKMRTGRRRLMAGRGRHPNFVVRYMDVFNRLGFNAELTFKGLFFGVETVVPLEVPCGAVGIAPFARYHTKTYPPELMEMVVGSLCAKGVPVYLFGARGAEAEVLGSWARKHSGCTSLAGRYEIETELALMGRLRLMVAMDSANHHLAALTGVRILSLWGGTTPACGFMAYGQDEGDAVCEGLSCQPCSIGGGRECSRGTLECLRSISPESLVSRIMCALNEDKERKTTR